MVSIPVNDNITLRTYVREDADALFAAVNGMRAHLGPWLDWVGYTTKPEHSLQFIQDSLHQLEMQEALAMGIFYDGVIIGGIGMHQWDHRVKKAQIGYWLSKDHEGKGIVTESLKHFFDFLFGKIGLNKIEIHFVAANKRSAKVAERMGCQIEGLLRQSAVRNGSVENVVIAGLLKTEWMAAVSKK